ncbi:prepilin-type N-terminal cleavage/methylation domain-containing protein [Geomonas paludis]|uniref:Prepilin-type N-terminal cleavage/methylation domain-containing protein n=1 Tax=Geomonas paludis TaxID=2740185 RepID=A0A6V8MW19_9BACT|nr:prepilin-type N-terminal cleavage/methylation domain-containing protein [Geomonas paludis]UPU34259.1 prepilin-type N-terminal cleavage/methylation domain-containing protein [Geomonas paludis]GFO64241.1 hypothetical protein GMPD_21600 [Geomonas paludis]
MAGFTLVELIVSVLIFTAVSTAMYATFSAVTSQVNRVSVDNSLAEKGQRVLSYLEEDMRMIGFLLGPDAQIPYCPGADNGNGAALPSKSPTLSHTSGNPYDTLTFLTSRPVEISDSASCRQLFTPGGSEAQKDCSSGDPSGHNNDRIDYYLATRCQSHTGGASVTVSAPDSCYRGIALGPTPAENGRSLVTFDSLRMSGSDVAGSASQLYYSLASAGTTLTFREPIQQDIPDGSTVYAVRMYRYAVVGRSFRRIGWDSGCDCGPDVSADLIPASDSGGASGGVDGVRFEFSVLDPVSNTMVTGPLPASLSEVRTVSAWLLLRADKPDAGYTDDRIYTLGTKDGRITLGPYRDHYRRVLLHKTVEVKNLASIN